MFDQVEMAPPDAILGITEAFKKDPSPNKINLSVGVYKDENGVTPILESVRQAESQVLAQQTTKAYLGIPGAPEYAQAVQRLMFGADHEVVTSGRAVTAHTPGGTGALRVAGDFLKNNLTGKRIWLSEPTWPNHPAVFAAAGVETKTYPYFDAANNRLDLDAMLGALREIPAGDIVLLHGCCHNPTGIDPTEAQWEQIADTVYDRGLLPLLDFAYQGFSEGIEADAVGLRALSRPGAELIVCSSFSKNFGLYRDRVGALTIVAADTDATARVTSQLKRCIRTNYSNPPAHGGNIVTTILADDSLSQLWRGEVDQMRDRINGMRKSFVETLAAKGVARDFSFIKNQCGMFSFSGLTPEQVDALRERHSVYTVRSGRINVAGITPANIDALCAAIADVL
jgi:aspartate/tyrosine/aromatic aminotransferase